MQDSEIAAEIVKWYEDIIKKKKKGIIKDKFLKGLKKELMFLNCVKNTHKYKYIGKMFNLLFRKQLVQTELVSLY